MMVDLKTYYWNWAHMQTTHPPAEAGQDNSLWQPRDPLAPTIFHEPWWLEAATGGRYEEVTVSSGGRTVGRLPYLRKERFGFTSFIPPELTHFLGPAVDEGSDSPESRNLRRNEITMELIEKLPPFGHFYQQLHRGIPDTLPFIQHGFTTELLFTYEVMPAPEETIWRSMRDKTRNVIRRAQEKTELVDVEPDAFCAFYEANLQERGKHSNYMFGPDARLLLATALERGRGRLLGAKDESGAVLAAICYVWDDQVSYYMLTTRAHDTHNGVVSRLIWEAMRDSAARGRIFDFDVVGTAGSVLFYTAFGGEVRPRYLVRRITPAYSIMQTCLVSSRRMAENLRSLWARRRATGGTSASREEAA
jgi:GNAT acetyltransferase-like protein